MSDRHPHRSPRASRLRHCARMAAADLAATTAGLYVLVAAGVLRPVDAELLPDAPLVSLAVPAAIAHLFLVLALLRVDWRSVWAVAAAGQVAAVSLYVALADLRVPAFEVVGISITALQGSQAILLAALALHRPASPAPVHPEVRPAGPVRVLVATGSTLGSTEEIGRWIAAALQEVGVDAVARDAQAVHDLSAHDAVVVGGSLRMGRWHPVARDFVRRHRRALSGRPVWLFSSGPLDGSAGEGDLPPVPTVQRLMRLVSARGHVTFGGRIETGSGGPLTRAIASDHAGDWRDPDRVRAWALELAAQLAGPATSCAGEPTDPAS